MQTYLTCGFCELVSSSAARSPCANFNGILVGPEMHEVEMGLVE